MNKQLMETITELDIKKAPEDQSLAAANDNYTKKQLAHFIERHDLDIAKSWKKAEIVDALTEWMESAQQEILEADSDLQSFYSNEVVKADESIDVTDENLSDKKLEYIVKLVEHGLAYNVDGQLWVPSNEVAETAPENNDSADQADEPKKETQKQETVSSNQSKPSTHSASPSAFKDEDIEKKKEARLKYLKKQAKRKKKGKKRK